MPSRAQTESRQPVRFRDAGIEASPAWHPGFSPKNVSAICQLLALHPLGFRENESRPRASGCYCRSMSARKKYFLHRAARSRAMFRKPYLLWGFSPVFCEENPAQQIRDKAGKYRSDAILHAFDSSPARGRERLFPAAKARSPTRPRFVAKASRRTSRRTRRLRLRSRGRSRVSWNANCSGRRVVCEV